MKKRTITWIIIGSLLGLLLIVAPIYYYIKEFARNGRSVNPGDWGTFGDYFGGTLSPILAFLTLIVTIIIAVVLKQIDNRTSERAIRASYQPQLVIEQAVFYTYPSKKYALEKPTEYSVESKGYGYESDALFANMYGVDIYNIGLGPAKTIQFAYEFDLDGAVELINDIAKAIDDDKRIQVAIKKTGGRYDLMKTIFPTSMKMTEGNNFLGSEVVKITHLLSTNITTKPYFLRLPLSFLELYTIYQYTWLQKMKTQREIRDFTPIFITIKYKDIGMADFENKFKITLSIRSGGISEFTNDLRVEEITL